MQSQWERVQEVSVPVKNARHRKSQKGDNKTKVSSAHCVRQRPRKVTQKGGEKKEEPRKGEGEKIATKKKKKKRMPGRTGALTQSGKKDKNSKGGTA